MLLIPCHKPSILSDTVSKLQRGWKLPSMTSAYNLQPSNSSQARRQTSHLQHLHDEGLAQSNYHHIFYQQWFKWRCLQDALHLSTCYYCRGRCTFRSQCQVRRRILGTGTRHSWTTCTWAWKNAAMSLCQWLQSKWDLLKRSRHVSGDETTRLWCLNPSQICDQIMRENASHWKGDKYFSIFARHASFSLSGKQSNREQFSDCKSSLQNLILCTQTFKSVSMNKTREELAHKRTLFLFTKPKVFPINFCT